MNRATAQGTWHKPVLLQTLSEPRMVSFARRDKLGRRNRAAIRQYQPRYERPTFATLELH
jgi:hypothetical protein